MTWYDTGFDDVRLSQGEILFNCSVVEPQVTPDDFRFHQLDLTANIILGDFVILSQSCDLEQDNIEMVVVSPVYSVGEFVASDPSLFKKAQECSIAKGITIPNHGPEREGIFRFLARECKSLRKIIDKIRKGDQPAYHLLNADPDFNFHFSVVDFHRIYSAPKSYLQALSRAQTPRVRLRPPYREHLSQAFARYFMRVGLPSDIRDFAG
jgi:hypothetical protein